MSLEKSEENIEEVKKDSEENKIEESEDSEENKIEESEENNKEEKKTNLNKRIRRNR